MLVKERKIGEYTGHHPGPLVVVLGAVHGNEPAGVKAMEEVFRMLEAEPERNPGFVFKGRITGFIGNLAAYRCGQRYIKQDLNRMWNPDKVVQIMASKTEALMEEELELQALLQHLQTEIDTYRPSELFILDLHSTSADGGIFSIPLESDPESIQLAYELQAPVVMGLLAGLDATFMHYANHPQSIFKAPGRHVHTVAFEAGQHDDPLSVNRAIAAVISLLRAVGCVHQKDVNNYHDEILLKYAQHLPRLTRIRHVHHIQQGEQFKMRPGYVNFQPVHIGAHLADNIHGAIHAPNDGYILMPLYQPQGVDGYFIVEEIHSTTLKTDKYGIAYCLF